MHSRFTIDNVVLRLISFTRRPLAKVIPVIVFCLLSFFNAVGQISPQAWVQVQARSSKIVSSIELKSTEAPHRLYQADVNKLRSTLSDQELIWLPTPNGKFEAYQVVATSLISTSVADQYDIKTYHGFKVESPTVLVAFDISANGMHATVFDGASSFAVEPAIRHNTSTHISYFQRDLSKVAPMCSAVNDHQVLQRSIKNRVNKVEANAKRRYRLAVAASGEYGDEFGGSPYSASNVLNSIASGVNIVNVVYLRDLGVDFELVSTAAMVFQDGDSDPFDTNDPEGLGAQSQTFISSQLAANQYDIGHLVVYEDLGGQADFKAVCDDNRKADGYSGNSDSFNAIWVDYVLHEIGHQFGGDHNFSSLECENSVEGFLFEPGEGSSIMSYATICAEEAQYTESVEAFFHYASIDAMYTFIQAGGSTCGVTDSNGNAAAPVADAKADLTIPKGTAFILSGEGSDGNDAASSLTYEWVQYDGNGPETTGAPNCTSTVSPMFRYRAPVAENYRAFPRYDEVLVGNNSNVTWEKLPCVARSMKFNLAVRDNNTSFGRVTADEMQVTVANTGPFDVVSPNGGETLNGNTTTTVTWSVNGTDSHCGTVDILLSTDGGTSYTVLADAVANDGSEAVTVPNTASSQVRVLVRCDVAGGFRAASTFYDVSNADLTIAVSAVVDNDNDNFDSDVDCDDNDAAVNPGAIEIPYNGKDDDCNASTKDDDLDGDGFVQANDCDDTNAAVNPDATEIPYNGIDDDCDASTKDDDLDGDGFNNDVDCDDTDAAVNSNATEILNNGKDDDCDSSTPDTIVPVDNDNDNYNSDVDCDDNDAAVNPGATEIPYNGKDDDCNPATKDDDLDGDGFIQSNDCNDNDAAINPDATEILNNGIDDDCDSNTPDSETEDDLDDDGFGASSDCDDNDASVNPDSTEIPYNGKDDDCNAATKDDDLDGDGFNNDVDCDDNDASVGSTSLWYVDSDGDGFGSSAESQFACDQPGGFVSNNLDCNDADGTVNPNAIEVPYNGKDDDCNAATKDDDLDGDGFPNGQDCDDNNAAVNSSVEEIPYNGIDDDCNPNTKDDDLDGDSYLNAEDCDDGNAAINPGATDIPDNGVDENCDGGDAVLGIHVLPNVELRIYPNPVRGMLTITLDRKEQFEARLHTLEGKVLESATGNGQIDLDLTGYAQGIYLLEVSVSNGTERIVERIMIQ